MHIYRCVIRFFDKFNTSTLGGFVNKDYCNKLPLSSLLLTNCIIKNLKQ